MLNTYGLKMAGLKKVSSETKGLRGYYSGEYCEVFYDISTGEVWSEYQYSLGQNTWTVYDNPDVIKVGNVSAPKTMQELADMVQDAVRYHQNCNNCLEAI